VTTQTLAATYSVAAVLVAVFLVVVLHRVEPEYDPSWRMLSEYSLGRYGVLMRVAFLAGGSAVVASAVALSGAAFPASVALVIVALGPLGAAFVDTDPITTPLADRSRRNNIHTALGSLFILGFPLAATVTGVAAGREPSIGPVLAWASIAPWLALAWFLGATVRYSRQHSEASAEVQIGWPNRVSMLVYLGWVVVVAAVVLF
jgi:hypothetical protein